MKRIGISLLALSLVFIGASAQAQEGPPPGYEQGGYYGGPPPQERQDLTHRSSWFLGTDQGVLFFVGDSSNLMDAQYYSTIFGGYNFKGYVQAMMRFGTAIGNAEVFFNPSTYWFIFEGAARFTPLRYKIRPYFEASAGLYVLSFDDFGFPVNDGANFTYSAGGGIELLFGGHNAVAIGSAFRGFVNDGIDLNAVSVTFSYAFHF